MWNSTKVIIAGGIFIEILLFAGAATLLYFSTTATDTGAQNGLMWGGIVCIIWALMLLLIAFCRRRTLRISLAIIQATVEFVDQSKKVLWVPLLYSFLSVLKTCGFVFALVCLYTVGTVSTQPGDWYDQTRSFSPSSAGLGLGIFTSFGLIWATFLTKAC